MLTALNLLTDAALAAAELLALLLVPPTFASEAPSQIAPAAIERRLQLHRLSTVLDIRLLGSLADVRVAQHVRNDGDSAADLATALPTVDGDVDSLRVIRAGRVLELLGSDGCGDSDSGHARLTEDESIADALLLAPRAQATIEAIAAQPLLHRSGHYRAVLPARLDADAPRVLLVDQGDAWFVAIVAHRVGSAATLILRPVPGAADAIELGALDPGIVVLVPLANRAQFDALGDGAVELELRTHTGTLWTTAVAERVVHDAAARAAIQADTAE